MVKAKAGPEDGEPYYNPSSLHRVASSAQMGDLGLSFALYYGYVLRNGMCPLCLSMIASLRIEVYAFLMSMPIKTWSGLMCNVIPWP
jgi:hypothetical protein